MGEVAAKKTHFMTFPHTKTGKLRDDFTVHIIQDGVKRTDVAYEIVENAPYVYTISFENDGTDYSVLTVVAQEESVTTLWYVETWEIRKKTAETNIKQVRSRMDSEGGLFNSSLGKE